MNNPLFKTLAYKLSYSSLALVFVFGVIIAFFQIFSDFRNQYTTIETNVNEIFRVTHHAAGRAVHLLDSRLADEVIKGLDYYNFLQSAIIYDDIGNAMATLTNNPPSTSTAWLTELLLDPTRTFEKSFVVDQGTYEGKMVLVVNQDQALADFYHRAITIFVFGLTRNLFLGLMFLLLYHYLLTKPLMEIARRISFINLRRTHGQRIQHLAKHEDNELGFIVNVTNNFIAELETQQIGMEQSAQQLRIILDSSPNQIFAVNSEGQFVFVNTALTTFYRKTSEQLIGATFFDIHKVISMAEAKKITHHIQQTQQQQKPKNIRNISLTNNNGELKKLEVYLVPFDFFDNRCTLFIGNDITDRVLAEERVENLAFFDTLTSLPNRNMLHEQLSLDIHDAQKKNNFGALFFIDLDDFKRINDSMGHSTGDHVLLKLSRIMQSQIRQSDTLIRLGGDEFTLSLPELSDNLEEANNRATEFAERLLSRISQPLTVDNREFIVSASIGIAIYPDSADNTESLLRFADTAMYQAKKSGRNCYRFFEPSMAAELDHSVKLESELRLALKHQQFVFFLQPIINGRTGEVVSAEALMRWQHPERGLLPPAQFISFLENSGNIKGSGKLMLSSVCEFVSKQLELNTLPRGFRVAVNVSAREFHADDFVTQVITVLQEHNVPGYHIELEITEGAALQRLDDAVHKMKTLQRQGLTFALDDFGTGYSSLSYLKELPVNKIKIDKSFIQDLTIDKQDEALVASIIAIANTLNLKVVAEGVETQAQENWLNQYDNVWYQGYLFDKPLPQDDFQLKYLSRACIKPINK